MNKLKETDFMVCISKKSLYLFVVYIRISFFPLHRKSWTLTKYSNLQTQWAKETAMIHIMLVIFFASKFFGVDYWIVKSGRVKSDHMPGWWDLMFFFFSIFVFIFLNGDQKKKLQTLMTETPKIVQILNYSYLSVYLSDFPYLSICLSIYYRLFLSIYLSIYLSISDFPYLSVYPSIVVCSYLSSNLRLFLSIYLSILVCSYLSVDLRFVIFIRIKISLLLSISLSVPICLSV